MRPLPLLLCSVLTLSAVNATAAERTVRIACNEPVAEMENFWHTFGFSPVWSLFDNPYHVHMAYAGSVPHAGLTHVRIHRILNLIGAEWKGSKPTFDWQQLDAATDLLRRYRLHHHFEFDLKGKGRGVPKPKGATRADAERYRAVARGIAAHNVERYGRDEIARWRWETPNEGQFPWNEAGVVYWDSCVRGLADVDPAFAARFGGPAALYRKDPFDFIKLLEASPNIWEGDNSHQVGYVSHHIKEPATKQVDSEIEHIQRIRQAYPRYADIPFVNTEHDPWNGWGKEHDWAYGPRSASWMANAIYQQQLRIIEDLGQPYFCSTDNGFMGRSGEWNKRTQTVLIGQKKKGFALIKKPAHTVFTLLALLGDERLKTTGTPDVRSGVGVLATRNPSADGQVAVMAFNDTREAVALSLELTGLPKTPLMLAHLRLDEAHGNPYRFWHEDDIPNPQTLAALRHEMELPYLQEPEEVAAVNGPLSMDLDLPADSVSLLLFSTKPAAAPKPVGGLQVVEMPGLHGQEHLLFWDDLGHHRLRTYRVLRSVNGSPFQTVDAPDLLCTALVLPVPNGDVRYRVVAEDYWGRLGK